MTGFILHHNNNVHQPALLIRNLARLSSKSGFISGGWFFQVHKFRINNCDSQSGRRFRGCAGRARYNLTCHYPGQVLNRPESFV
jgi:hypothetical protein